MMDNSMVHNVFGDSQLLNMKYEWIPNNDNHWRKKLKMTKLSQTINY